MQPSWYDRGRGCVTLQFTSFKFGLSTLCLLVLWRRIRTSLDGRESTPLATHPYVPLAFYIKAWHCDVLSFTSRLLFQLTGPR